MNPEAVNQLRLPVNIIHGTVKKLEVKHTFEREKRDCKRERGEENEIRASSNRRRYGEYLLPGDYVGLPAHNVQTTWE